MLASQSSSSLTFKDDGEDRTAAMFQWGHNWHPKTGTAFIYRYALSRMGNERALTSWSEKESVLCPPMFHAWPYTLMLWHV